MGQDALSARILFVCAGSTCRSPMAAALAADVLPDAAVESAAWPPGEGVAHHAVSVIKEMTGRDISDHTPRDVSGVDLSTFDQVIVLDQHVATELGVPRDATVETWAVEDPFGGVLDDYRRCAENLRVRIAEKFIPTMTTGAARLQADIGRWRTLLPEAAPTYCQGIANLAAKRYEALVKGLAERIVNIEVSKLPLGTATELLIGGPGRLPVRGRLLRRRRPEGVRHMPWHHRT
jgi:protein-tyrosine-phosphatase